MDSPLNAAQMRVEDLITALGSGQIAPGSGAAGAVTLALAAACAAKAVAITLKHEPQVDLERFQRTLERIARFALLGADQDAAAFTAFIKEHSAQSVAQLIDEGDRSVRLIEVLSLVIDSIAPRVDAVMSGDIVAARALTAAARQIVDTNRAEAHAEQSAFSHD